MKRLEYDDYGGIDKFHLAEVSVPEPGDRELLVRVHAAGINELDWKIRNAKLLTQDGHQWPRRVGCEFAGIVEQAGGAVTSVRIGEEVFGWVNFKQLGAMADYILVNPDQVHAKPPSLSMQEAAGLPMAGATAYTALRGEVDVRGKSVLINGGSGGVGHLAIQIARMDNAHVTAVGGPHHRSVMERAGANRIVNYQETDVRQEGVTYDLILDTSRSLPWSDAKPLLNEHGVYLDLQPGLGAFVGSYLNNLFSTKKRDVLGVAVDHTMLHRLYTLVEDHGLKVHVGREYALMDYRKAYETEENGGGSGGKAIIVVR